MSKNLCDSCRIHLLDCETAMCEIPRKVAEICGSGGVTRCGSYKPFNSPFGNGAGAAVFRTLRLGVKIKPAPKPPEVVRVATVEITHIGSEELGQDSLRMKCVEAELRNRLRNAFPEADNINIARVQEFVLDGE